MGISDFDFYAGFSIDKFLISIGHDPSIPNNLWWFRAEDIPVVADGTSFDSWPEALTGDFSPNRLVQTTPIYKPLYYSNVVNGYPVAQGPLWGIAMFGEGTLFSAAPATINLSTFVVTRATVAANGGSAFCLQDVGGLSTGRLGLGQVATNTTHFPTLFTASLPNQFDWHIESGWHRAAAGTDRLAIKRNNFTVAINASNLNATSYDYKLTLNSATGASPSAGGTGIQIAEMVMINGIALTEEQHSQIVHMLAKKYAISLEQPDDTRRYFYADARDSLRAELHSNLIPTLPAADGYFVRAFENPEGAISGEETLTRHILNDGYFIGLDNTQGVSVRAWVRAAGLVDQGQAQVVLFSHMDDPWRGFGKDSFVAYGLKFGTIENDGYAELGLRIATRDVDGYVVSGYSDVNCSGTYDANQWYRIRLDVIPVGAVEDRISAYVGTGDTDAETWTPVGNLTIPSTSMAYRTKSTLNKIGYYGAHKEESGSNISTKFYIDRFKALRKVV